MTIETYESGNRRAEVSGTTVTCLRVTGNLRQSHMAVWNCVCDDAKRARCLAKRWEFKGLLGKKVVI